MPDVILKNVPAMKTTAMVPVLDARTLDEAVFQNDFVAHSRPCVIKGAISHWAATTRWRNKDYLKAKAGHHEVFLFENEYHVSAKRMVDGKRDLSFAQAVDQLHAEATTIAMFTTELPLELIGDLGGVRFLKQAQPAFCYPPARYFFFRNAGTAWHYHPFDETLMCQVIGSKQVGLVNGNTPSNISLRKIFFKEDYYDNPAAFDALAGDDLRWLTATVEEGDALYIPPLWWHGVVPLTQKFGATAAVTWRSPLPVIASAIRKMAMDEMDMVGKHTMPHPEALRETARQLGLEREFAIAWARGF